MLGEKEHHSHTKAHVVTIYSGSIWTCMNQNTSVSHHISFIQTTEGTIFPHKKLKLSSKETKHWLHNCTSVLQDRYGLNIYTVKSRS